MIILKKIIKAFLTLLFVFASSKSGEGDSPNVNPSVTPSVEPSKEPGVSEEWLEGHYEFLLSDDESYYILSRCINDEDSMNISSIYKGKQVKEIGDTAFNCSSVVYLYITSFITSIGYASFEFCQSLKSVVIEEGLKDLGDYAFKTCTVLKDINVINGAKENWIRMNESLESDTQVTIH